MSARPRFSQRDIDYVRFDGGLDVMTPPLNLPSGFQRSSQNTECAINGGYSTVKGYERYDGHPSPSDAAYAILNAVITGAAVAGDTLTGATSGATGVVIAVTSDYFALTKVSGTFVDAENLEISAVVIAVADGTQITDGAPSTMLNAQYNNLAADQYRADIAAIPGSGRVRGVVQYNDVKYGFRDNAGATECKCYKSSAAGWVLVSLGFELAFTSGSAVIAEGSTVTGATSGASAVLSRQVLEGGTYLGGTAVGRLIFASVTGTFQNGENLQVTAVTKAVSGGAQSAITLDPAGRFEFELINFGGTVNTKRIYGCDGVNRGFEFDGTVFVPINTGMSPDTPKFVKGHKKHLFFSFGGSAQHSGPGTPYQWTLLSGAAELAVGDDISNFVSLPGDGSNAALGILTRNSINILYGNGSTTWNLVSYDGEQGSIPYTANRLSRTLMFDDRGIVSLETSINFGNFQDATISDRIQKWLNGQRTKAIASCLVRDKNQYRLFFSDNYALFITMSKGKVRGMTPVLFNDPVRCVWSGEMLDGSEAIFFGSDEGFVYQMEKGTSFDGDEIEWHIHAAFNPSKNPRLNKNYKHATFEMAGDGYAQFDATYELGYAKTEIAQKISADVITTNFSAPFWDSFTWDAFVWDGVTLSPSEFTLNGTAENISLMLHGKSDYHAQITFSGALLQFIDRRIKR